VTLCAHPCFRAARVCDGGATARRKTTLSPQRNGKMHCKLCSSSPIMHSSHLHLITSGSQGLKRTSRRTSSLCCPKEAACELPGSALLGCLAAWPADRATVMDAPQGAAKDWVSRCLAAKFSLDLHRFSGLRAHSGQNLFSAGQVRCLHKPQALLG